MDERTPSRRVPARALERAHRDVRRTILLISVSGTAGLVVGLMADPLAALLQMPELLVSTAVAEQGALLCAAATAFVVGISSD